jgi:hypothetical protein
MSLHTALNPQIDRGQIGAFLFVKYKTYEIQKIISLRVFDVSVLELVYCIRRVFLFNLVPQALP